jgi:hypothetical protein
MAFYNTLHGDYDNDTNGGKEDHYHGEYDDDAYGSLYIPHIESGKATLEQVKYIFQVNEIGSVTSATFTPLVAPKTYKGKDKNKKQLFSANVYVKWNVTPAVSEFYKNVLKGDSVKTRLHVDKVKGTYLIVRPNTIMTDELMLERYIIKQLEANANYMAGLVIDDGVDDELEEIATDVAMKALSNSICLTCP